ncbi:MAG: fibronectin type III domain-containing protein [Candidatus Sericytochromatia bacterium]
MGQSTPSARPDTPSGTAALPAGQSGTPASGDDLTLSLRADASLAGFITLQESAFNLCLSQIANVSSHFTLPSSVPEAAREALRSQGAMLEVFEHQITATLHQSLSPQTLLAGIDFRLKGIQGGSSEGHITFFDASGTELGFLSWRSTSADGSRRVTIVLRADEGSQAGESCPRIRAAVSGASFLDAEGRVATSPLPPIPSPSSSLVPSAVPSALPASVPGTPQNVKVVEQTPTSLTLQWDFGAEARSHKLYLDGQLVAEGHASPNYFRFENLQAVTTYRLGVQSVNAAGESERVTVATATLDSGRTASGNFSGGGSGGGKKTRPVVNVLPGPEFVANSYTTGLQVSSQIAMDDTGNFVLVWSGTGPEDDSGIYGQRFANDGTPSGSPFHINSYTNDTQSIPQVAMDADGDFIVAWTSNSHPGDPFIGVFAQRYDSLGQRAGSEFQVNQSTETYQFVEGVSMNTDGDFIITWRHQASGDAAPDDVYARHFFSAGSSGNEFLLNAGTVGNQANPAVALNDDGSFAATWQSFDGDNYGVFARYFANNDLPAGCEFLVNTFTTGYQAVPDIATDGSGHFTVTWESDQEGNITDILARSFTANGSFQGSEFRVNSLTAGQQSGPSIAMDAEGDFTIAWQDYYSGTYNDSHARRFAAGGTAIGSEFTVNNVTAGFQSQSDVALDADGDFTITWSSYEFGIGNEVKARLFSRNYTP